jgi:uncharacterized protein YjiS (DUF1127 family)
MGALLGAMVEKALGIPSTEPAAIEPRDMNSIEPSTAKRMRSNWHHEISLFWIVEAMSLARAWLTRIRHRQELRGLDARQLDDVGLDPERVRRAIAKPFWQP